MTGAELILSQECTSTSELATLPSFFPIHIQLSPVVRMTQDQFFDFCQLNADKRFERTAEGALIIMPPFGGDAGFRNTSVSAQLYLWCKNLRRGKTTGPSGGFILPNGANRAPDAAWLSPEQLATITPEQRQKFLPVCPYFLVDVIGYLLRRRSADVGRPCHAPHYHR